MFSISFFGPNFSISYRLKSAPKQNGALFKKMKEKILGKKYELSVVFISSSYSQKLNRIYRNKDKVANILSFSLDKNIGEIFISSAAEKNEINLLLIHGLCHLKGYRHGSRMETEEKKYHKFFNT